MSVEIVRHSGWGEIVLDRPERRNAITGPLGQALEAAVMELDEDPGIELLVLRGAGGAFCSGLDLKEFNADPAPDWLARFPHIWRGVHRSLFRCRKPILGALERYAINGGAALALACDLVVTGRESFLQIGEVRLGMAAPYNLAWLALRFPEALAAQLTLVGARVPGPEMVRLGLAFEAVPDAEVLGRTQALAEELAAYPAGALGRIKRGLRAGVPHDADTWFDRFTTPTPTPPRG